MKTDFEIAGEQTGGVPTKCVSAGVLVEFELVEVFLLMLSSPEPRGPLIIGLLLTLH